MGSIRQVIFTLLLFSLFISSSLLGAENHGLLSTRERDSIRYHLENLYNEMDLLVRNQKIDSSDLQRQEQDFAHLKVYDRIPLKPDRPGLRSELNKSAQEAHVLIIDLQFRAGIAAIPTIPTSVYTDSSFRLRDDQIAERIHFVMQVQGDNTANWIRSLPKSLVRYTKADRVDKRGKLWTVYGHALMFRDIQFPLLIPKSSFDYLPVWSKKDPVQFAVNEPVLWNFLTRIEALKPQTPPLYSIRRKFLLNDARLNLYLRLTKSL